MSGKQTFSPKNELDKKMAEQKVLQNELESLRKGAAVYRQQQNSNIFFLSNMDKEMFESKKTLDNLMKEYKDCEVEGT